MPAIGEHPELAPLRTRAQIMALGFLAAKAVYLAMALVLSHGGLVKWGPGMIALPSRTYAALVIAFAVVSGLVSVTGRLLWSIGLRPRPAARTPQACAQRIAALHVVRLALSEVPALLGLMLYLLRGEWLTMACFLGYSIALDAFHFPSAAAFAEWMEQAGGAEEHPSEAAASAGDSASEPRA